MPTNFSRILYCQIIFDSFMCHWCALLYASHSDLWFVWRRRHPHEPIMVTLQKNAHFFVFLKSSLYLCSDLNCPMGLDSHIIFWKRTFTNVIFYLLISQITHSTEDTQPKRPLWVYCAPSAIFGRWYQYVSAWAISSCLSSGRAMREPASGISEK